MCPALHPDDDAQDHGGPADDGPWAQWPGTSARPSRREARRSSRRRSESPAQRSRERDPDSRARTPRVTRKRSASRLSPAAPWRDVRIILGLALLLVSTVMGMRVLSSGPTPELVWVVQRDLPRNTILTDADVRQESVVRPTSVAALTSVDSVVGSVLGSDVHRDQVLTSADLTAAPSNSLPTRLVSVPIDVLALPPLQRGDRVDVWSVPDADSALATATLVLANVTVMSVASADAVGVSGDIPVVLAVPTEATAVVLQAVRDGGVAVVAVPVGSRDENVVDGVVGAQS